MPKLTILKLSLKNYIAKLFILLLSGFPFYINVVFYLSYSIWLICILTWAAYNLGLLKKTFLPLPERHNLATPEDDMTLEHIFTPNFLNVRY